MQIVAGATVTTAALATALKEAINGEDISGDNTRSTTGDLIGEFAEVIATVSGSVVTVTAVTPGKPFTMTATEVTAGSGTATYAAVVTATGPSFWDNVDNWSDDTVPVNGDTVVFDSGDTDLLYNLTTAIEPAALLITQGYSGKIGLPVINQDSTNSDLYYDEYRTQYLTFANDAGTAAFVITIGEGEGAGSDRLKLNYADCTAVTVHVRNSGNRVETNVPVVLLKGTATDTVLNVQKGNVGVAFFPEETAHLATVRVGYLENQDGDSDVVLGLGVDITDAALAISGGKTQIDSTTSSGSITLTGGTLTILSGAHVDVEIYNGTVFYRSTGTLGGTLLKVSGTLDFRKDNRARTVSTCFLYAGGRLFDPQRTGTYSAGVDLQGCALDQVTLDLGTNFTVTPSEI